MSRRAWRAGEDVVLVVTGKYTLLGSVASPEWEDGRVLVRWEDRTTTRIQGDLLVTPGDAATQPEVELESARLLVVMLEAQLAAIQAVVEPMLEQGASAYPRLVQVRGILGVTA